MNRLIRVALAALASITAAMPTVSCASGKNQLIDDFWMREKSTPAPARSKAPATPTRSAPSTPRAPAAVSRGGTSATAQGGADLVPAVQGLPPDPGDSGTYRLASGDIIKVQVFQVEELSSEERVSEDGEIVMPLIGPVRVGGMTPKAAEAHIAGILGTDYLQNPQVDIYVTESANQQITVMGSVNKPGVFPVAGRTTLLQAIALAEGTDRVAKEDEVVVFRPDSSGAMRAYVVDLRAIQRGDLADPVLVGEDRVVVRGPEALSSFARWRIPCAGLFASRASTDGPVPSRRPSRRRRAPASASLSPT